jgi:elongator complex protein 3
VWLSFFERSQYNHLPMMENDPSSRPSSITLWQELREVTPERQVLARHILADIQQGSEVTHAIRRCPLPGGGYLPKSILVAVYKAMVAAGECTFDPDLLARIRMKPVRTISGVTTVTVLTKPYPCPGKCVFCPTDARMPKSYLPDEPGAMRGVQNDFDPYLQVRSRIDALEATGHPTEKIELLILGGTWSAYRRDYQQWFVKRCFDALNEVETSTLAEAQQVNETAPHRNVGLVIETRPDEITAGKPAGRELAWLRYLGVTKVQMGAQSLDDHILDLNKRGHTSAETLRATALLRAAGFKVVLHWMPNLLGATLDSDRVDFARLWSDGYAPDEIKIYPCQLLANAELYEYWQRGAYTPYTQDELVTLIADIKPSIPLYCRVNRVIRDIPSTHVVAGNKRTSLRMDVFAELSRRGQRCTCIRCREVKGEKIDPGTLRLVDTVYAAGLPGAEGTQEHFLQFVIPGDAHQPDGRIAGYLRLSLPGPAAPDVTGMLPDLKEAALIREVHVYGQSLAVGEEQAGAAQHIGLGTRLLDEAVRIAGENGFPKLAVIAAVGTRLYYENRGFERGESYLVKRTV